MRDQVTLPLEVFTCHESIVRLNQSPLRKVEYWFIHGIYYFVNVQVHMFSSGKSFESQSNIKLSGYSVACIGSRCNERSDWLIQGHYSPVILTGRLLVCQNNAESHVISNLLSLKVRYLQESLNLGLLSKASLDLRFSSKNLILGFFFNILL